MNKRHGVILMLLVTCIPHAGTAYADEGYAGVKFGPMMIDLDGVDDPMNIGLVFGSSKSGGSLEGELTTSLINGGTSVVDVTISTFALYGAYRSEGEGGYFKFKGGFVNEKVKAESNFGSISDSDSGASFGFGFGSRNADSMFEIEFTLIEQDVNFLSLGVFF